MKQLARRASLVVVLLLLASVATASAECAWVLWRFRSDIIGRQPWERIEVRDGRAWCVNRLNNVEQNATRSDLGSVMRVSESVIPLTAKDAPGEMVRYECLPDTIDPREPKGK
jgi:hypothetical protein